MSDVFNKLIGMTDQEFATVEAEVAKAAGEEPGVLTMARWVRNNQASANNQKKAKLLDVIRSIEDTKK